MQLQTALLGVQEHAHQPAGVVAENPGGNRANFSVHEFESIDCRFALGDGFGAKNVPGKGEQPFGGHNQGHALFHRARDQINVPAVMIKLAHETFNALAGRAVMPAEAGGNRRLEAAAQNISRTVDQVMQFVADPEQETVGAVKLFAFGGADHLALLQVRQRAGVIFEMGHPEQVLIIAQASATILDVRLLHTGGIAVFGPPQSLVLEAGGNVFVLVAHHTLGLDSPREPIEQYFIAKDAAGLDQGRFRLHVVVGHSDAVINRAH